MTHIYCRYVSFEMVRFPRRIESLVRSCYYPIAVSLVHDHLKDSNLAFTTLCYLPCGIISKAELSSPTLFLHWPHSTEVVARESSCPSCWHLFFHWAVTELTLVPRLSLFQCGLSFQAYASKSRFPDYHRLLNLTDSLSCSPM